MIFGLQTKLAQSEQNLREANARLSLALEKHAKLANEKNALAATVKKLNRDVAKLETFKKTLMQSLQDDDEAPQADATENIAAQQSMSAKTSFSSSLRDGHRNGTFAKSSHVASVSLEKSSSVREISKSEAEGSSGHGTSQGLSLTPHLSPQLIPTGSRKGLSTVGSPRAVSAAGSLRRHSASRSPTRGEFEARVSLSSSLPASHRATAPNSPPHPGSLPARTQRVDGKEFFRQTRNRLSYEQFSAFLSNIKELNSHRQSREETLRRADEIFGPDNKDLYVAFDGLLSRHLP
eukprot:Gb_03286 [translate_table: standard]